MNTETNESTGSDIALTDACPKADAHEWVCNYTDREYGTFSDVTIAEGTATVDTVSRKVWDMDNEWMQFECEACGATLDLSEVDEIEWL